MILFNHGVFTIGEDNHEDYCTLCGDGGDLVLCDKCPRSFCKVCLHIFIHVSIIYQE